MNYVITQVVEITNYMYSCNLITKNNDMKEKIVVFKGYVTAIFIYPLYVCTCFCTKRPMGPFYCYVCQYQYRPMGNPHSQYSQTQWYINNDWSVCEVYKGRYIHITCAFVLSCMILPCGSITR